MTTLQQGRNWFRDDNLDRMVRRGVVATVVRVRAFSPEDGRHSLVIDCLADTTRTPIMGVVYAGDVGVGHRRSRYPRAATLDLSYPVGDPRRTLPAALPTRLGVMAAAPSPQWDGDKVLVIFIGGWAVAFGNIERGNVEAFMTPNQWSDGGAKSLPAAAALGAPWVESTDELPCVYRPAFPGCVVDWDGAVVTTRWADVGVVTEVRKIDGSTGSVTADFWSRIEQSRTRIQLRAPKLEIEIGQPGETASNTLKIVDGTGALADVQKLEMKLAGAAALLVDTAKPAGMDALATHQKMMAVIATQAAQIQELQTLLTQTIAALNVLAGQGAAATAAGPTAAGTTVASALTTMAGTLPKAGPSAPAPTQAQKDAVATKNVRAATL